MHIGNYTLHPLINGLSDHDGQILQLTNLSLNISTQPNETKIIHNFCKHNIHNFKTNLSYEVWDTVFVSMMLMKYLITAMKFLNITQ